MPAPLGPYSPAVRAGDTLYLAGQIGMDPSTTDLVDGFEAQVRQGIKNLFSVLEENGAGPEHLVKTQCFIENADNLAKMNEIYTELFDGNRPARSTVVVAGLPRGALFEIEGIAYVG